MKKTGAGTDVSVKEKKTALILCILLGWCGIHCFYVGRVGRGILYMLTFGILGLGWIIDVIWIATGSFRDSTGAPLKV